MGVHCTRDWSFASAAADLGEFRRCLAGPAEMGRQPPTAKKIIVLAAPPAQGKELPERRLPKPADIAAFSHHGGVGQIRRGVARRVARSLAGSR